MSGGAERGRFGEDYTAAQIQKRGMKLLARNFRRRGGELDLVAEEDGTLVFIEVKTRKFGSMTEGADALDRAKMRRILLTAQKFAEEWGLADMPMRFDLSELTVTTEERPRVLEWNYYPDAFDASGFGIF
ncbi:MAG: YraN family protein [Bacteroides sp.]|nr:YraN family protein [Eubacterium sp.]MCM1418976.1 YraN family protein [Roseburia sp.]MCM1463130.1 YraN family protein [Bacteroides sp.]